MCCENVGFCGASGYASPGANPPTAIARARVASPLDSVVRIAPLLSDELPSGDTGVGRTKRADCTSDSPPPSNGGASLLFPRSKWGKLRAAAPGCSVPHSEDG